MQPASPYFAQYVEGDNWLTRHLDVLTPGKHALDLGCGWGEDTAYILQRGLTVTALDLTEQSIERARYAAPDAAYVVADMAAGLPFPPASFEVVVASLSLHYFRWEQTRAIVSNIRTVLVSDGWLLCRVNRVGDVHHDYGQGPEIEPELFEVGPGPLKRFFTEETLTALLGVDFEIDAMYPETTLRFGKPKVNLVARAQPKG